jgi:hypothetical protein
MGLEIGTLVKIKNLKSRPELNGCEAKVIDFRITNKRYGLELSGGKGEKIAVKPENIQEVGGKDAASAASAASTSTLVEVTNYSDVDVTRPTLAFPSRAARFSALC